MIYKVGIVGATGRMGQEIGSLLHTGFVEQGVVLEFGDAIASTKKIKSVDGVPVHDFSEPVFQDVHVWIDFSRPKATLELLKIAECPIVIGTTGFSEAELNAVKEFSKKHPVLLAPNTSPGLNWLLKLLGTGPLPAEDFDLVLTETHHKHKKDAPSGTLKAIQKVLAEKGFAQAQVHSIRAGEEKGTHEIRLYSEGEEIVISHRVLDRRVFARGALLGALFLLKKKTPGLYSYADVEVK